MKRLRPNKNVFKDVELSVHLGDVLEDKDRPPSSVLDGKPSHHLVALTTGFVTEEEQVVSRDPQAHDESHGLVTGAKPKSRRDRLALAARWETLRREALTPELQADLDRSESANGR